MTSTLFLYHNTQLTPQKNFKIDYLADFLLPKLSKTIPDFQYIKHALNLTIKIDLQQTYLDRGGLTNFYDYIGIQNDSETIMYYFITATIWKAQKSVEFDLTLDTINSFNLGTDYNLSAKTLIEREHRDRFQKVDDYQRISGRIQDSQNVEVLYTNWNPYGENQWRAIKDLSPQYIEHATDLYVGFEPQDYEYSYSVVGDKLRIVIIANERPISSVNIVVAYSYNYDFTNPVEIIARKVDLLSENLTPQLYKHDIGKIEQDSLDWYLIYKNQNEIAETEVNPVNCYICASENISLKGLYNYVDYTFDTFTNHYIYILNQDYNENGYIIIGDSIEEGRIIPMSAFNYLGQKVDAYIKLNTISNKLELWEERWTPIVHQFLIASGSFIRIIGNVVFDTIGEESSRIRVIQNGTRVELGTSEVEAEINGIDFIDRTDAKLIKIIKLPYSPIEIINGKLVNNQFIYEADSKMLKLNNLNNKFGYSFSSNIDNPMKVLWDYTPSLDIDEDKNMSNESKLYHSDFYMTKFVYDSFSFVFELEKVNMADYLALENKAYLTINYIVSSTINSRFLFRFPQYTCGELETQDYNNILNIARNNEIPIFSNSYVNYIRTGFNYDVKTRERSVAQNVIAIGLSALGTLGSLATGGALTPLMATGLAGSIASAITSYNQATQNQQQKITQLQNQATSVYGSDDVDLMSAYSDNRAKLVLYQCDSYTRGMLYNLFYYTGYIANYYGIPNLYTRDKFNYIQATIDFIQINGKINNDMKADIEERYKRGLTIIHRYRYGGEYHWDFSQLKENWEISLLED